MNNPIEMEADLIDLLELGWDHDSPEKRRQRTANFVKTVGIGDYLKILQTHPVKISEELNDLGPVIRLQMLFNIVNELPGVADDNKYSIGCEVFRNIE